MTQVSHPRNPNIENMNNTFDIKRFGTYFVSDLRNAFNNTYLTVLITSVAEVIAYLFCGLMHLVTAGTWISYPLIGRLITFIAVFYILIIIVPSKAYGFFTDKRSGSFYTLIPASALEKTLSMIINVAVIAPLAYTVISLGIDALLCLVDPHCGQPIVAAVFSGASELNESLGELNISAGFNVFSIGELILGLCFNILCWTLTFLLGALYFKKNKIGKTILAVILFSMVMSTVTTPIFFSAGESFIEMIEERPDAEQAVNTIKWVTYSLSILINAALLVWTYFRVKKVKY